MSALERRLVQRVIDTATAAGMEVPAEVRAIERALVCAEQVPAGGRLWVAANPNAEEVFWCCDGAVNWGADACTCWEPVYDLEQAPPRPITHLGDLLPQPRMCGDCAYRLGSPERSVGWQEEGLMELTTSERTPFFCHSGMRRPISWAHPDGRTIAGCPADYQPLMVDGIPYQADGSPGLLCAGWTARVTQREHAGG